MLMSARSNTHAQVKRDIRPGFVPFLDFSKPAIFLPRPISDNGLLLLVTVSFCAADASSVLQIAGGAA